MLAAVDLRGSNLRGVNLADAVLTDTDLTGSDLRSCNLDGADLSGADLTACVIATGLESAAPEVQRLVVDHFAWLTSRGRKGAPASCKGMLLRRLNLSVPTPSPSASSAAALHTPK